mmetsp:Transcript_12452/g.35381  ORF Transcript_12452/g.35381 Transcript_12452/m.35381 type:complete len:275 (+) Transcript_12452:620-1444(+)
MEIVMGTVLQTEFCRIFHLLLLERGTFSNEGADFIIFGHVPGVITRKIIGHDFDHVWCACVLWHIGLFTKGIDVGDCDRSVFSLAAYEFNFDLAVAIEIFDDEGLSEAQRSHLCRRSEFHDVIVLANDCDHVNIFHSAFIYANFPIISNIIACFCFGRGLSQMKHDECVGILGIVGNAIKSILIRDRFERIDRFDLVFVPSQLVTFGGIVAHFGSITLKVGVAHHARLVAVFISEDLSAMTQIEIVSNLVHLGRDRHAPWVAKKRIFFIGNGVG